MSSLSIENNSERSEDSLDSGTINPSQISSKPKRMRDQFKDYIFVYTIKTNLFGEEEVSTDEKELLLSSSAYQSPTNSHDWPRLSPPSLCAAIFFIVV